MNQTHRKKMFSQEKCCLRLMKQREFWKEDAYNQLDRNN